MNEGWYGDDYLILFAKPEIREASERYSISEFLPGFQVVGLRGWDDFIVRDTDGRTYSVPTVSVELQYLWVSHEQHAKLVRWWNDLHRSTVNNQSDSLT